MREFDATLAMQREGLVGTDNIPHLTPDAEAVLAASECSSVPHRYNSDLADVIDCDGNWIVTVTRTINPLDMQAMLVHGARRYARGLDDGRAAMRAAFRNLLEIPA